MYSPDMRDEKNRRMEFATNPVTILNSLENMGYKVLVNLSWLILEFMKIILQQVFMWPPVLALLCHQFFKKCDDNSQLFPSKVVTSGSFVSGQSVMTSSDKFCNREFIWTLHRFTLTLIVILGMVMVIFLDSIETNILLSYRFSSEIDCL